MSSVNSDISDGEVRGLLREQGELGIGEKRDRMLARRGGRGGPNKWIQPVKPGRTHTHTHTHTQTHTHKYVYTCICTYMMIA